MDSTDRRILARLYVAALEGRDPEPALRAMPDADGVRERLGYMARDGLVGPDRRPTEKGSSEIKVVLAGGVFDIIHPGHIHTLREAASLGDVLVVVIATDRTAVKMKRRRPLHSQEQRRDLVGALKLGGRGRGRRRRGHIQDGRAHTAADNRARIRPGPPGARHH